MKEKKKLINKKTKSNKCTKPKINRRFKFVITVKLKTVKTIIINEKLTLLFDNALRIRIADFGTIVCLTLAPICLHKRGICPMAGIKSNRTGWACNNEQRAVVPTSRRSI